MYNYQQQVEQIPVGIPIAQAYPMIQDQYQYQAPSYMMSQQPQPMVYSSNPVVSQNINLIAQSSQLNDNSQPYYYPTLISTQPQPQVHSQQQPQQQQPYVSKWQQLAQLLNNEEAEAEKAKAAQAVPRKPKDPKDMTPADHLQVQIEAQNEKIKEKQQQMLNFVQPKVISQNTTTTSVESQIPIRKDPVANYQQGPKYVIHKVNPNDTLDRICIIYNVPKDAIRKANDFIGDEIYMKKELIIPDSFGPVFKVDTNPVVDEERRRKDLIDLMNQRLWQKYGKGQQASFKAEAQYYLEITNYDYEKALKEFEEDLKFEHEEESKFKGLKNGKKGGVHPLLYIKK